MSSADHMAMAAARRAEAPVIAGSSSEVPLHLRLAIVRRHGEYRFHDILSEPHQVRFFKAQDHVETMVPRSLERGAMHHWHTPPTGDPYHLILIGAKITELLPEEHRDNTASQTKLVEAVYRHESAHSRYTTRERTKLRDACTASRIAHGDWNCAEDNRIENLERAVSGEDMGWKDIGLFSPPIATNPISYILTWSRCEGDIATARTQMSEAGIPDAEIDITAQTVAALRALPSSPDASLAVPAIVRAFLDEIGAARQKDTSANQDSEDGDADQDNAAGKADKAGKSGKDQDGKDDAEDGDADGKAGKSGKGQDGEDDAEDGDADGKAGKSGKGQDGEDNAEDGDADGKAGKSGKGQDGEDGTSDTRSKAGKPSPGDDDPMSGSFEDAQEAVERILEQHGEQILKQLIAMSEAAEAPSAAEIQQAQELDAANHSSAMAEYSVHTPIVTMAHPVIEELEPNRVRRITGLLAQALRGTISMHDVVDPTEDLDVGRFVVGNRACWNEERRLGLQGPTRILLMVDCSGSMSMMNDSPSGSPIGEARYLVAALSTLAQQGRVTGHVVFTQVDGDRAHRCQTMPLPLPPALCARINADGGGEGLDLSLNTVKDLAIQADTVALFTDAHTDAAIDPKLWKHRWGVDLRGLYVGSENCRVKLNTYVSRSYIDSSLEGLSVKLAKEMRQHAVMRQSRRGGGY